MTRVVDIPVRPECVIDARRAVWGLALDAGLGRARAEDLLIAVSEAVTNAMEAQLAAGVADDLALELRYDEERFEVTLEDQGEGFDPADIGHRPPMTVADDLRFERGWGIALMHTMVDDVAFETTDRGTAVRLVVELDRSPAAEPCG